VATTLTRESAWLSHVRAAGAAERAEAPLIGALPGEGVGPEVVDAALKTLRRLESAGGRRVEVEMGGPIGLAAEEETGSVLPEGVVDFCREVFSRGGAVLSGPGGGRYVYELRRRLGLFLKISPIHARHALADASAIRRERLEGVDLLVVRENLGGIYQGRAETMDGRVEHRFSYAEADVSRFLEAAARLARSRRGELTVVVKRGGLPELSRLWCDCAVRACGEHDVELSIVDVDLLAYRLVERPASFDVVAAPNLFGDVIGDLAAAVLGSRGISFGASYTPRGDGVYQTNHGAAHDIAGSGRANPVGQILSLATMLRESLSMGREAWALEQGIRDAWNEGWRTADLGGDLGGAEMAERIGVAAAGRLPAAPA
jgi:3-isopropylmalate dehydrogenase